MKAVIQRVTRGSVQVEGENVASIQRGLVVFIGVQKDDTIEDADYFVDKISHLRIFPDERDMIDLSIQDVQGEILLVSQFTLLADCRHGRRPSFMRAAVPEVARKLYDRVVDEFAQMGVVVKNGIFQEKMYVDLENDGPFTIVLDSKEIR